MEKMFGAMIDCSRNGVMKPEVVKQYAKILKEMGYNTLMLYTEDTYEINNNPFFGHLRGRYSKQEIKDMDAYCNSIGIELVPCIQTLAHLNCMFKWISEYNDINDCDDILLAKNEKTYKLIGDMLATISECFTSKKIHIGMDEAYRVGKGKYLDAHGLEDRFDVINDHLHRVCELCKKYDLEPMIWNDMFYKLAFNTESQYDKVDISKIMERAALPENISLVYWDYYSDDYEHYCEILKNTKLFGRKVYFAGGAHTWYGFAPDNENSMRATKAAFDACNKEGIDGVFLTLWGDDGSECSKFSILPALLYGAEIAKGNNDMDSIKKKFREIVGADFDTFLILDRFDSIGGKHEGKSPSKNMLYNDTFMGIRDYQIGEDDDKYYKAIAEDLHNAEGKGRFKYMFDAYEKYAQVLSIKATLGLRTRKAYLADNKKELENIIEDYKKVLVYVDEFFYKYREMWFAEYKPHGFDVQDIRFGALSRRLKSCMERLMQYVNGEIDEIPELKEPVLDKNNDYQSWARLITPNVLSHLF